ncbi:MAG: hypothetical protein BJ554DRAFT_8259, partial [Olpidium bornovanus]
LFSSPSFPLPRQADRPKDPLPPLPACLPARFPERKPTAPARRRGNGRAASEEKREREKERETKKKKDGHGCRRFCFWPRARSRDRRRRHQVSATAGYLRRAGAYVG